MRHIRLYAEYVAEQTENAISHAEYVADQIDKIHGYREAISGTEVPVPLNGKGSYFGAGYGDTESPNTIDSSDTKVIYSKIAGKFFTEDQFKDLYDEFITTPEYRSYVQKGGNQITNDFTEENIDMISSIIQ